MTISNASRTAGPFTGNGVTTDFPFTYKVFTRADVLVARTVTASNIETILVLDSDYFVVLNSDQNTSPGGIIHLATPLAVGTTLAATSNIPIIQSLDLTNGGGFYPKVINDAFDRIVITIQQLATKVGAGALNIGSAAILSAMLGFVGNIATAAGASLVGFSQNFAGAVLRTMQQKAAEWKTPEDFGAKGNDPSFDDTPAFVLLYASAALNGHSVMLPKKTYYIRSLTIYGCNETTTFSQGAKLRGRYTGSFPHILRIDQTSITMNLVGTLLIDGACNVGYTCGLFVGSGYNDLAGFSFLRCALCILFDRDFQTSGNRGISEIKVTGGYTFSCLRIIEARGYNTIVNLNGFVASTGLLTDANTTDLPGGARPAAWDAADSTTIRAIGATLVFTGAHLTNVRGTPLIDVQPIVSPDAPALAIAFGTVLVSASNIEAIKLGGATNPGGLPTPDDQKVNIGISGCQGFIGGNEVWCTLDGTFNGTVRIRGNSFYSATQRTNYLGVSNSGYAHWDVDSTSFGKNISGGGLGSGLNAFMGGIAHYTAKQILRVNTSTTATASNGSVIPTCTNSVDAGNSTRFLSAYGATGFVVPRGGLQDVIFDMQFALASASPTADVGIKKNGTFYKFGPSTTSPVKTVTAYFPQLFEGDIITPYIGNNTGAAVACDGSPLNQIIITASNP